MGAKTRYLPFGVFVSKQKSPKITDFRHKWYISGVIEITTPVMT
ncbi:MAG: hypothetical protein KatS3mg002_1377 [Candidatus Woesearchaeota archaeon]|nr:MAG: hypothetical protein KatS3mg002_1377 [Candidatus Woesearchaeota archaeon]